MRKINSLLIVPVGLFLMAGLVRCDEPALQKAFLPTPRDHYEKVQSGMSGIPLTLSLLDELDPETQKAAMEEINSPEFHGLLITAQTSTVPRPPKEQTLALLQKVDWKKWRPLISEFMLHQSQVLEIIPPKYREFWVPIVHDALLYFLNHLPEQRFMEKLVDMAYLPRNATPGEYLRAFVSKTPSLQKTGQILARNPALSPEHQAALQQFENGIHSMNRDELVQFISNDIGEDKIEEYRLEFADEILAEASVGAVIRATLILPHSTIRREAVCKVVKPYALINLPQELDIIDGLASYFTTEHEFYQLGSIPLGDMFKEVKKALTEEIDVVTEQKNLARARQYYQRNKRIVVPELYPISTKHVTVMEYVPGEKITSAFEGQPEQRAILARRLSDVMTRDVIFASSQEPVFHGDPHAGNVFHVIGDPEDPYRIALLDWGLYGTFPRKDRIALMQLILGVQLKDGKRLRGNIGALLENGIPDSPEKRRQIDAIIAEVLVPKQGRTSFDALAQLLGDLVNNGYATKFSLNLFIKSQVTISGILNELDPKLDQDGYLMQRVRSLAKKEIPKRILFTLWFPAWNSHSYRSLLSNQDVFDARKLPKEKAKKTTP